MDSPDESFDGGQWARPINGPLPRRADVSQPRRHLGMDNMTLEGDDRTRVNFVSQVDRSCPVMDQIEQ